VMMEKIIERMATVISFVRLCKNLFVETISKSDQNPVTMDPIIDEYDIVMILVQMLLLRHDEDEEVVEVLLLLQKKTIVLQIQIVL